MKPKKQQKLQFPASVSALSTSDTKPIKPILDPHDKQQQDLINKITQMSKALKNLKY